MAKNKKPEATSIIPQDTIEGKIIFLRGKRAMLDRDLAELYGVETRVLTQAVKRNLRRFPDDFMFQLTKEEFSNLMSQIVISRWGGTRKLPYVFTEQGVAMLSGVLNSDRAIDVNVQIMRAFVRMRKILSEHADLKKKIEGMERKYDAQFKVVFDAIRQLLEPPQKSKKRIGF